MIDSLHLQEAQHCLAYRCTQSWPTHDSLRTLASITDTVTTADLLSKGVLQTFSFTGTKDSSEVSAPTTPMQKLTLQPHKGTEALQPHRPEQSATELKSTNGKHSFYAHLMSIINVHTFLTSIINVHTFLTSIINVHTFLTSICIAEALMINGAQCIAHLLCMLVCNMMPLIAVSIWLFLTGLGVVAAMHTEMSMNRSMHAGDACMLHEHSVLTFHKILTSRRVLEREKTDNSRQNRPDPP